MKKISLLLAIILITSGQAYACPMCMGDGPNDKYYLYVIGAFIIAIYFPMFYLFKTFIKFKNVNNNTDVSKNS